MLAGWLAGVALAVCGVVYPWFWMLFEGEYTWTTIHGEELGPVADVQLDLSALAPWAPVVMAMAALIAILGLAAHFTGRAAARSGLAAGALLAWSVAALGLVLTAVRLDEVTAEGVGRYADITQRFPPKDYPQIYLFFGEAGFAYTVIGVVLLALVAAGALWPGRGGWVAAGAGLLLTAACAVLPWVMAWGVFPAGVREWHGYWLTLSPMFTWPAMAAALLSGALTVFALARSSTAGRLPIMAGSVLLAAAAGACFLRVGYRLETWVPAAERTGMIEYTIRSGPPEVLALAAQGLLATAAVLAWLASRRRARTT